MGWINLPKRQVEFSILPVLYWWQFFVLKLDFAGGGVMRIANRINGGRRVMIPENVDFDLEGRCSIQLSYEIGRAHV